MDYRQKRKVRSKLLINQWQGVQGQKEKLFIGAGVKEVGNSGYFHA